jgi:hypothetical protein
VARAGEAMRQRGCEVGLAAADDDKSEEARKGRRRSDGRDDESLEE